MNKKIRNGLIIGAIIVVILVVAYIIWCNKVGDILQDIKIIDSYGKKIEDLEENKMPFTINDSQKNKKIKVNGKTYQENERIYKTGKYEIEVSYKLKTQKIKVNINDIEKSDKSEYNIYVSTSTLPTFMAMLNIVPKENVKGFFWTQRPSSIDVQYLRDNYPELKISDQIGNKDETEFKIMVMREIRTFIQETLNNDSNAFFNLYVDDYRYYMDLELFAKIGIDDNRYNYIFYSDGTSSYIKNNTGYEGRIYKQFKTREENGYEDFVKYNEMYNKLLENLKSNKTDETANLNESYYIHDYMLLATLRSNVKYLLQFPQMISYEDDRVKEEMQKANMIKINLKEEYSNLTQEQKEEFNKIIKLDKSELDANYFKDENQKYLIITGANPFYGNLKEEKFREIISKVKEDYGDEYIILYKPHPAALPDEKQQKLLNSFDIKVLTGTIPMEAIMFMYPNIKLGGFASSLYMSAEEGQTEFFFSKGKDELVSPLNILYDDLFSNAKFYN